MSTAITEPSSDFWRKARRGLTIYFAVVVLLSALFEGIIIFKLDIDGLFIAGLMWVPAVASAVALAPTAACTDVEPSDIIELEEKI